VVLLPTVFVVCLFSGFEGMRCTFIDNGGDWNFCVVVILDIIFLIG
jgi:hypothetical protein